MDILGPRSQTLGTWLAVFLAGGWAIYELRKDDQLPTGATMSSKLLPILLIATLFITAAMHVIAAVINRRQPEAPTDKPQGVDPAKHEEIVSKLARRAHEVGYLKGEVEREQLLRKEQVEIRDRQISERGGRIGNLEQQLRVSQNTVDILRDQLSAPNGRFKLKRVRYIARNRDRSNCETLASYLKRI
ncbi:MAG TPA: hypothetical protein VGQ41_13645 [Pyrinomonadaceae bacterium]|jgi:hypothetical protein|nr:hypothetical protein [Pyrinomonadaceae bacterium]